MIVAHARRTASFTSRWGAVTAALCIVHLTLSLAIPEAPLRLSAATPAIAWGLLSQEFIAIGALAVLPALPGTWYSRGLMSFVVTVVIGGGWIAFLATDQFPGIDSARFLFTVPEQAFEHLLQMRAAQLLLVPIVMVIGTVLLTQLALYAGKEFATRQAKILVVISATIVGGSLIWHGVAKATLGADDTELLDPRRGVSYRTNLFWMRAARLMPVRRAPCCGRRSWHSGAEPPNRFPSIRAFRSSTRRALPASWPIPACPPIDGTCW